MLVLRSSPLSPFGRKVRIAADMLGLAERIKIVPADTSNPEDDLRRQNPLGKIPVLLAEDGTSFYDSGVILEYLDHLAGGGRIVPAGAARFTALTHQALFDGVMDACILRVYEARWRPAEHHVQPWLDHQTGKVERALAHAEANLSAPSTELHLGHITQACALGYLDFRFGGTWRETHPRLVAWLNDFAARVPAFGATKVSV
jgi:glutathione S-transferase